MATFTHDPSKRQRRVEKFAAQLGAWFSEWNEIDSQCAYYPLVFQHTFMAVEVIYYSVLTLLHRGSTNSNSPKDISPACFAAARQGLESHLKISPAAHSRGPGALSYYSIW